MRYLLVVFVLLLFQAVACKKNNNNCSKVIITNTAPGCTGWGIVVNGTKYPSRDIPSQFQQPGIFVCAEYDLYDDMTMCACCGGTWAHIISMTYVGD